MRIRKECKCGKVHETIPIKNRPWIDEGLYLGVFFECGCECGCESTLFIINEDINVEDLKNAG